MNVIEKAYYKKIGQINISILIILLIISFSVTSVAFGQNRIQLYEYCEPGHSCFCIESSGTWVDKTTGFRINTGCTSDDSWP